MVYKELVDETARRSNLTIAECRIAVDALFDIIKEQIEADEKVIIKNFGTFFMSKTKSHKGLNPFSQELVDFPVARRPFFHQSRTYKEKLNSVKSDYL